MFNQLKLLIKDQKSQNEEELYQNVHRAEELITPQHRKNYFQHMETYLLPGIYGLAIENWLVSYRF